MEFKSLQDKYNYYRSLTDYRLMPNGYVMVMLDGRAFSKFIKNRFDLPFDDDFAWLMDSTAAYLCQEMPGTVFAYVQSDEITLVLKDTPETQPFFANRLCKLISISASLATGYFNRKLLEVFKRRWPNDECPLVQFDSKAWNLPNVNEVVASVLYRQIDCIRNSKQQTAQTYLPHKRLMNKNVDDQLALLANETGVDWNGYKNEFKHGRLIRKVKVLQTAEVDSGDSRFAKDSVRYETYYRSKMFCIPMPVLTEECSRNYLKELLEDEQKQEEAAVR